ncbi:hypothetical protein [Halalkalibacter nanhaiisediminis]|uniref:Glycosyl transferase family 4 n=1 Tax=Halalkalibacter nanhaiisediminis TaxID=688079 RepID=A0A562QGT2_9BACI|nr:hypothetical protein [Halalkalibacter nanhaiisediminis]TWI55935.1 glycosyl transferase family 4 [Halalkalibacter nanhaiisediminis]
MIPLLITLPVIAYFSMIAFHSMNLTVVNYEGKLVPYSLGVIVLYSYAVLYAFPPYPLEALSLSAFLYIIGIWLLGFIDDRFGKPYPKGLRGHIRYVTETRKITTGLLKAIGTIGFALLYLWTKQPNSFLLNLLSFFLLTGLPHTMNLFDTRPLRVWKASLVMTIVIFIGSPLPSFYFVVTIIAVYYILFVLEGHRKAMLGDNGATVIGAMLAIVFIHHTDLFVQIGVFFSILFFILLAEKWSISTLIESWSMLRVIDQIGIVKK